MHALPVNLPCVKQLPVITNEAGASPHAGSTCAIGVVTVRPFNRQPAQLYFKLTPDPNNTFFFIFTCTTQYPWVLANPDLSQAMASSKQKRTHTVFRASSTHRSASTSKPRFAGERVKLGDVCTIVSGATPKTKTNEYWGGEIRWVTPAELDGDSHYISDTEKHLTEAGYKSTSLRMMPKGTVLLTTRAPIGKVAIAAEEMSCNQGFKNLVCSSAINNEFLYLYLKSRTAELQAMGRGATFKELSKKNVAGFEINLPAIDRQLDAVAKLTAVRSQIALAKQQHDQLDSLVKSRFVEMFGDPDSNPHGLEVCPLGKVLSVQPSNGMYKPQKDYVSDGSGTPIIRIDSFRSEGPDYSSLKRLNCNESECRRYGINENDIVINRVNSVGCMGKTMLVSHIPEVTVFESNMMRLHSDEAFMIPAFLCAQMTSGFSKSYFEANAKRAIGQASINQKDVKGLPVLVPTIANQKAYLSFVSQVDKSRFVRDHEINFR